MNYFWLDASALDKAIELREDEDDLIMVGADLRLLRAAEIEGMLTVNPETDSLAKIEQLVQEMNGNELDISI